MGKRRKKMVIRDPFAKMSKDIQKLICSFLNIRDLCKTLSVCSIWNKEMRLHAVSSYDIEVPVAQFDLFPNLVDVTFCFKCYPSLPENIDNIMDQCSKLKKVFWKTSDSDLENMFMSAVVTKAINLQLLIVDVNNVHMYKFLPTVPMHCNRMVLRAVFVGKDYTNQYLRVLDLQSCTISSAFRFNQLKQVSIRNCIFIGTLQEQIANHLISLKMEAKDLAYFQNVKFPNVISLSLINLETNFWTSFPTTQFSFIEELCIPFSEVLLSPDDAGCSTISGFDLFGHREFAKSIRGFSFLGYKEFIKWFLQKDGNENNNGQWDLLEFPEWILKDSIREICLLFTHLKRIVLFSLPGDFWSTNMQEGCVKKFIWQMNNRLFETQVRRMEKWNYWQ